MEGRGSKILRGDDGEEHYPLLLCMSCDPYITKTKGCRTRLLKGPLWKQTR